MPIKRILCDNNVPINLVPLLRAYETVHASRVGWAQITNGDLIKAAHADGFDVIVTCDQRIEHQQNLAGRSLAFVVLSNTHRPTIVANVVVIIAAIEASNPGSFLRVTLPKPPKNRNTYQPPSAC